MPLLTKEYSKLSIKPEAARLLTLISRLLAAKNTTAYIVGGLVRDILLGRDTADIDIALDGDALEIAARIAAELNGTYVPLDDINRVGRVVLPDKEHYIDFSTISGTIEEDLGRRDFSVNAIAYKLDETIAHGLDEADIIDPFHGRHDLEHRTLKALNADIFTADSARLMRAVRIAAELDLKIDPGTEQLLARDSRLISSVAGERTREELVRLLARPDTGKYLFLMDKLGLLTALIPELGPARGVDQPRAHVFDVFEHSLQTVNATAFILRESAWEYGDGEILAEVPWSERIARHFDRRISSGSTGRSLMKLAALLHDIAKPQTKTMDAGRARFIGHHEQGAAAAAAIMERLRFSRREITLVELLITHHLRPTQMSHGAAMPTNRAIYRFFRDLGESGIDILYLALADHLAARGPSLNREGWREHTAMTAYVLEKHFEEAGPTAPLKLLDGREIMDALGLPAGPEIGEMVEAINEAQAAGDVNNKADALQYIQRLYREKNNKTHK